MSKINPDQSAFPNLHMIDGNWIKEPRTEYMGMPIRLELAARFVAAILTSERTTHILTAERALKYADALIEKYNE